MCKQVKINSLPTGNKAKTKIKDFVYIDKIQQWEFVMIFTWT